MSLPGATRASIDAALGACGLGRIETATPVGGGCISNTTRVRTSTGSGLFLKWSTEAPAGLFGTEVRSLETIAASATIRVPDVVAVHDEVDDASRWLLLEWLEPGAPRPQTWTALGVGLAALHRVRAHASGWPADNFIGSLPQSNAPAANWPDFWRSRRLEPQLRLAHDRGAFDERALARFDRLFASLDVILAPASAEGASLLHGDLWGGNLHVLASGAPAIVDPASYYGHREVDLAMTELFGGFDAAFHAAYRDAWPLEPGYAARRRSVYQLYYLLVHVNLFGGAYAAQTLAALKGAGF